MVGLIPRLVLNEGEVSKIIHDAFDATAEIDGNESIKHAREHDDDESQMDESYNDGILKTRSTESRTATYDEKNVILTSISNTVNTIKDLPHRATFRWRHLLFILAVMILCPLLGEVVFVLPMNSVDDGPNDNRVFIYGIMTLYQLFMQLPWVETCNFAMPQVNLPIRARLVALVVGLTIAKVVDLILTTGVVTYAPVFPIPFSILVTGSLGTLPVVPILYFMTTNINRKKGNFGLAFLLLVAYWIVLLVVIGWAIGIQRLQGNPLQYLVVVSYAVLRFVCKVLICANISTRLQPQRHIQLNLVVDVLFTRVQVATWPFIDSPFTLMTLFASESSIILWRYYVGVDRIQLWWGAILTMAKVRNRDKVSKKRKMKGITEACFTKSNQYIINMSLSDDKGDVVQSLACCKTSSTLDDSSSSFSISNALGNDQIYCSNNEGVFLDVSMQDATMIICDDENCDPSDVFAMIGQQKHNLAGILRRPIEELEDETGEDFVDVELSDSKASTTPSPKSPDESWEQRDLYHMVDSTGSLCINTIVRINQQLIFIAVRNLPSSEHLNESFQISDERWYEAQIYGSIYITLMMLLMVAINFSPVFFSEKKGLEGKKLSLGRVLSYLFKDNFWFFFFWLISTGALVSSAMVNHFGADFSMNFEYLGCLDNIEWPGCPSNG